MSSVDERIVKMVFDNADFASKVASTINSITQLNKATDQVANNSSGISAMSKAFEQAEITATKAGFHIRDVWLKIASILEYQVAGKIVSVGKKIANAFTFEGIADGLKEYETQLESVQTIMANTGLEGSEGLAKVNATLDELNEYADKTIYNFTEMTRNIGTFTAAGLDLDTSAKAIQGIANLAAVSGSTSQQASTAMYQLSQALAAGTVKLQDWNSVVNAGMGGKVFQNALIQTAAMMDGMGDKVDEWKQKHIDAYGSFRESLTKDAWLTSEVLSQTLSQFTMAAEENSEEWNKFKKELMDMGYTEQAANDILKMANTATDAATKVKTFTQLIDTLKEAIGSGWAQSWRIIIGDFEEAKTLWTEVSDVLGGFIDKTSDARNELLKGWDTLGGRAALIDGVKRAFDALLTVIKPISEGFRNIFPPVTAQRLFEITKSFQRFTASLKISEETADKVRKAASGFFAIFDIGIKFVSGFVKALSPATKGVSSLGGFLLDAAANIGDFITKIDIVITKTNLFERVFKSIGQIIKPVIDTIKSGFSGAKDILVSFFEGFTESAGKVTTAGEFLKNIFNGIGEGIKNVQDKLGALKPVFEGIANIFKSIGKIIGEAFKQISDSISGFSTGGTGSSGILAIFNGLLTGGILYKIFGNIKSFTSIGESLTNALDSVSDAIGSFQKKIKADNLLNIAKAIAILAGSLVVVAMIDQNKLLGATTAITALMFGLAGAMTVLMKAVNSFSTTKVESTFSMFGKKIFGTDATKMIEMAVTLKAVSKALVSMGEAVLMMAVGLKLVASAAEGGHLWDSFAVVSLMLAELTAVTIALGKWGNSGERGAKGLLSITSALVIMAAALKMISNVVADGNAWESLGILSIMLGELTGIVVLIEYFGKYNLGGMTGLISLAVSLNICVLALKSVSDVLGNEGNHIWESLAIISIMLAELAGITVLMGQFGGFAALGGAGAIMAAAALLIMVQALKQVSDALGQTDQHIWQALGVIAASLLVLAVGLTAMAATIPGAAGLLIASAALVVLGGALKIIGSLSLAEIGKGLLAMAGSLTILAVGLTAMIVALPGAAALIVAAAGLTVLAGALKIFGSMSLGEIVKSLGALVVALTGIAVVTTVLSVASPFILAFSVALLAFGAALLATGAGFTVFAAGLQALASIIPVGAVALQLLGTTLLELIPVAIEAFMDGLGILCTKIVEYGPEIGQAVMTIVEIVLQVLVESALKIGEAVLQIIIGILTVLTDNIPKIAKAGADMMVAYMQAISNEIPRVVDEAYKCAIALINGLADAIESNNGELIEAVDHLMDAAIQAITQWLVEFTPLGLLIPENVKEGIMSGELDVKGAIEDIIKGAIEAIKGFFSDFKQAAEYLVGGLIEGLKGTAVGQAVSAAVELGGKVIDGLNSKKGLDENSPSHKAIQSGTMVAIGLKEGIEEGTPEAVDASTELGDKTIGALSDTVADGAESIDGSTEAIADSFKDMASEVTGSTNGLGDNITNLANQTQNSSDKVNKSSNSVIDDIKKVWKEVTNLDDVSKTNIKTEERWGSTLKAQEAAILKNQKATEGLTDRWGTHNKVQEEARKKTEEATKTTEENTKAQEENATASGKSEKATKDKVNVMEYASGVVEAFTKKYGHLYETLGDDGPMKVAAFAVKNLAEKTYEASLAAEKATEKNKDTKVSLEDMIKTFTEFREKIYDSVKSVFEGESFFMDEFEMKTELTMSQVLSNMQSHINGVTDWANKLEILGDKGVNQGLLKYLTELGPKGYELVNAFSTATTEEIQQANMMFEQAAALPDTIADSTLASYAKAGLDCVQGFADGIDNNSDIANKSLDELATTGIKTFKERWGIGSPSKVMYDDGMWLIMGLKSGMNNNSFEAHNAIVEITQDIVKVAETNLDKNVFYEFGSNIGQGLADGMNASASAVRAAAENLSKIAASVTTSYNGIKSPSKLYRGFGSYIAEGFAMGMEDGEPQVVACAKSLSQAVRNTIETVKEITENDMELNPVISPVLDLTNLKNTVGAINGMFPGRSLALASSIGGSIDATRAGNSGTTNNAFTYGGNTFYITAHDGETADQLADRVINKLDRQTSRRKAVYGL